MRIALICLRTSMAKLMPPLGLMYLASSLRQMERFELVLLDEEVSSRNPSSISTAAERIISGGPDILCFTAMTEQHILLTKLIHLCRTLSEKKILVIVGGPHASLASESCALTLGADFILRGPGEGLIKKLLSSLPERLEQFHLSQVDCRIINGFQRETENLELSAYLPDRSCIDFTEYQYPFTLMTARGCSGKCSFCSSPVINNGKVFYRNIDSIISEVGYLARELKVKNIAILDDSFTQSETRLKALCEILKENNIKWFCESRLDCVDEQKLLMMREAGCAEIQFGIECFDQDTLDRIGKTIRAKSIPGTLEVASDLGIKVAISLMIGLPGDTVRSVKERIGVAVRLAEIGVSVIEFGLFRPFPGTAIYQHSEELGYGDVSAWWEQEREIPICFPTSSMTRSELIAMAIYAKYKVREVMNSLHNCDRQAVMALEVEE